MDKLTQNEEQIKLKIIDLKRKQEILKQEEKALKNLIEEKRKPEITPVISTDPDKIKYKVTDKNIRFYIKRTKKWVQFLDDRGRIIEEEPLNNRTQNEIKKKLINEGTLTKGLRKAKLENVTEYIDNDLNLKKLNDKDRFQYAYSVFYNGKEVIARSTQFRKSNANKTFADKHAYNNMLRKLSYIANGVSDADVGEKILKDKNLKIRKKAIYYKKY